MTVERAVGESDAVRLVDDVDDAAGCAHLQGRGPDPQLDDGIGLHATGGRHDAQTRVLVHLPGHQTFGHRVEGVRVVGDVTDQVHIAARECSRGRSDLAVGVRGAREPRRPVRAEEGHHTSILGRTAWRARRTSTGAGRGERFAGLVGRSRRVEGLGAVRRRDVGARDSAARRAARPRGGHPGAVRGRSGRGCPRPTPQPAQRRLLLDRPWRSPPEHRAWRQPLGAGRRRGQCTVRCGARSSVVDGRVWQVSAPARSHLVVTLSDGTQRYDTTYALWRGLLHVPGWKRRATKIVYEPYAGPLG